MRKRIQPCDRLYWSISFADTFLDWSSIWRHCLRDYLLRAGQFGHGVIDCADNPVMTKNKITHFVWQRYAIAIAFGAMALVMMLFRQGAAVEVHIRLLLLAAVMLSSWFGGVGPGLVTTIFASIVIVFASTERLQLTDWNEFLRLIEFIVVALLITFLNDRRRRAQERAEHAQSQAEAANRGKDEFIATVSHELRTPLTAILGWIRALQLQPKDNQLPGIAVEAIERNARHLSQLIEDLLDMSRLSGGQFRLEIEPIDLAAVIESAIDVVRPALDAKGLRLRTRLKADVSNLLGDERRIKQVVWNLLSNAVKFTSEGGLIQVNLNTTDSHAYIVIKDTGIGIAPELLPHVFERFCQGDRSRQRNDGLGLGLAIAKELVELHGGTLEVHSQGQGKGAVFTIALPARSARRQLSTIKTKPTMASAV
jgi:signal transduction histidine kinase